MTSAHDNLAAAIDELAAEVKALRSDVATLLRAREDVRLGPSAAAVALGYKPSYFGTRSPWRVPGYGLESLKHSLADWRAWNMRPESERRQEWDSMPLKQRERLREAV